jgi:hypothetical protein
MNSPSGKEALFLTECYMVQWVYVDDLAAIMVCG